MVRAMNSVWFTSESLRRAEMARAGGVALRLDLLLRLISP
ncbi:hypothetical protein AtDm6_2225 [Acetobacter tropicalis]|uniref:Uncharacterized protein n=2 Tax=Acetobacter tropicalis TaxID=104102 RepID=F7VE87_9PROT|nr:hypothetical protein AtDm6_2225 [Acetobacter tropicalis]GAA08682.1 hypothetical protein ATPR_1686 [Acetobacter tropicalis NBRC 101654]